MYECKYCGLKIQVATHIPYLIGPCFDGFSHDFYVVADNSEETK